MNTKQVAAGIGTAVAAVGIGAAAVGGNTPAVRTNGRHPEQVRVIQALNEAWDRNVAEGNLDGLIAAYASHGRALPQHRPPVVGKPALRAYWGELLSLPGFAFSTTDSDIVLSASGDMAWVTGGYELAFDTPAGRFEDVGSYVLIYEKIGGDWKLVLDIDNSDNAPFGEGSKGG